MAFLVAGAPVPLSFQSIHLYGPTCISTIQCLKLSLHHPVTPEPVTFSPELFNKFILSQYLL